MNVSELKATRKGKVVLRKGLKIVHSPTGLEYTVADIFRDGSGKLKIRLSPPEDPRVAPIASNQVISEELPPVSPEAKDTTTAVGLDYVEKFGCDKVKLLHTDNDLLTNSCHIFTINCLLY